MAFVEAEWNDQFQIGADVMYLPEGVITTIIGYVWLESVDGPPKIHLYILNCGISVPKSLLSLYIGDQLPARQHHILPTRTPVDAVGTHHMPSYPIKGHRLG